MYFRVYLYTPKPVCIILRYEQKWLFECLASDYDDETAHFFSGIERDMLRISMSIEYWTYVFHMKYGTHLYRKATSF